MVVLYISYAVDPQSNTSLTHIPLRAILGVLQIGIRAEAIEKQVKNVLLDYKHFENIALVKKGLHETFMHTFMHMLVAVLVVTIMSDSEDSTVTYTTALPPPDYVPGPEEPEQEEEEEPSGDDADEEDEEQDGDDDDEKEEHPASADSIPPPPALQIRRQRAKDIGYGIRDTWIDSRDVAEEEALTTLEGVNTRVTELTTVQEQDTQDIYGVMEDIQ
nr:hypothetical protein [Tanacetum cinerariifolium]